MPALDARAEGAQAPGLSRGSGEDAAPTPADVGGRSYAFSRSLLAAAGMKTRMPWREAERRLQLQGASLVDWTLAELAEDPRRHGVRPVFLALDNFVDPSPAGSALVKQAERAGFLVFDLFDLWHGRDQPSLRIASPDRHPNGAGTLLIAERLLGLIHEHHVELRIEMEPYKEASR